MKTLFLTALLAITIVSCNNKAKETETNSTETNSTETNSTETKANSNELFACPMHPEVQGKLNDKCSKCGMDLTEPVPEKKEESK
ncbi:heavy metal-binding domain-containing protein [Flavobacterium sp.]|uniref:heavy metal-binding domain-containing protein n=1 Tax=Flavobacterium sp. TaxID=239 RepID=UPI00391BDF52